MITVINGSNRKNNHTAIFADFVFNRLKEQVGDQVNKLDLADLGPEIIHEAMYQKDGQASEVSHIQEVYFKPSDKFWFFVPEYNGSIPGILKLLIDAISVREGKETFSNKKACITGIASGRAGNLRGMDHLADILNHMNVAVLPNKQPISSIYKLIDKDQQLVDESTKNCLEAQKEAFLSF
ncbi:MAG: NAD(P)H-dependent oxidoreductase [Bacteroidota bacterium]